tara:strand:- start:955 stop:1089 length:135 start_codon:yes stop_codon:yes gene_type:complete
MIAISIPNEDNKFPLLAVFGCDNLLIPKIKATADKLNKGCLLFE